MCDDHRTMNIIHRTTVPPRRWPGRFASGFSMPEWRNAGWRGSWWAIVSALVCLFVPESRTVAGQPPRLIILADMGNDQLIDELLDVGRRFWLTDVAGSAIQSVLG